jgi:phage terminase large subunit-like protein
MKLFDCQRRPLELALSRDEKGHFKYTTILWSWPKKSAKSSIIAAVADYVAEHKPNASVKLIANDLRQADSRVGYYLREDIKLGQRNGKRQGINITPSGYRISYPNGAKVESVPVDPTGEAGGNDDMMVYSELWGWKSKAHQRMWSEMTISPTRFGNSQRWIDTYAGITGESPILEQLYDTGVKQGVKVWEDHEVYVNDSAKMLTVWVTKPMLPWQTDEYYAQEAGQLTPSEFARMHRNQWSMSAESFIPLEWWHQCRVDAMDDLAGRGVIIAIDAAVENDCFAIVVVSSSKQGKPQVRYCNVWIPPKGGQIDFSTVETELLRLFKMYNVTEVAYDPYQMASMAQRLSDNVFWKPFLQGAPRLMSDKMLYDLIRDGRIEHSGEAQLEQHIINADRKPEDDKVRIIKRNQAGKIDAVVALSMACARVMYYNV